MKQGVVSRFADNTVHHLCDDHSYEIRSLACPLYFFAFGIRPLLTEGVLDITDRLVIPSLSNT